MLIETHGVFFNLQRVQLGDGAIRDPSVCTDIGGAYTSIIINGTERLYPG